jgi:hypothetical protein
MDYTETEWKILHDDKARFRRTTHTFHVTVEVNARIAKHRRMLVDEGMDILKDMEWACGNAKVVSVKVVE